MTAGPSIWTFEGHGLAPERDDAFPGRRRFYLRDNNGNRPEVLSPAV